MGWNIGWLFFGAAAFVLVIFNLIRVCTGKTKGWAALLLASMSCGAGAILSAYHQAANWALCGDMAAIQDVVPTMASRYTVALVIGIVLNLLVLAAVRLKGKG
ncbi:MAG TPA: hypothetical protein H9745_01290 [Candidatus Agathobaculum stercoravium]|nr:hypothetical protein [Candidatus Agathobaculum stercoravium]